MDKEKLRRDQWLTLLVLSLALLIVVLDTTIVIVTIQAIRAEFNASLRDLEWITAIYALVFAAFIITWGRIGDEFGRRRIFIAGVATFVIGSVITGLGQNIGMLLVGRLIQGFGAAMSSPSTLSILSTTFTGRMRGVAFGIWGATAGAAGTLGPLLGGFLTTYATWRGAFLINVPIGAFAIIGALLFIEESRDATRPHSIDIVGVILAALGLSALVFGLIEGQTYGWLRPTDTFSVGNLTWEFHDVSVAAFSFAAAVIFLAAFVLYELSVVQRGGEPLFDFSLLRFRGFRYGLMTVLIVALGEFGMIFVLSLYLQITRELSAFQTGVMLLPFSFAIFVAAPVAGTLSARFGPKGVVTTGMVCEAIAIFSTGRIIAVDTPFLWFVPVLTLYGVGVGLALAQLTNLTLSDIPPEQAGAGSAANNTVRQIGAAIGIAVLGAVLTAQLSATGRAELAANRTIPSFLKAPVEAALNKGLNGGVAQGLPANTDSSIGQSIRGIVDDGMTEGSRGAANAAAVFVVLGALSSLLIPNAKSHRWAPTKPQGEGERVSARAE
jgi:EmrB/QacA subfamily drug resistance transporter